MIFDIVIGALVFIVAVSHIHWRLKFGERLIELERSAEKVSKKTADCDLEMRFPKREDSEERYFRYMCGLRYGGRDVEEIYFHFLPLSRVVKDLMTHTGMEYKYEESKPEKIEAVKKVASRKRK